MSLNEQCAALVKAGRLGEAERICRQSLAAEPGDMDAAYQLGLIRFHQREFADALVQFESVLAAKPDHVTAWIMQGLVLQAMRRPQEALSSHDRALALDPDNAAALTNRGSTLAELKRFGEALASLDHALRLKPDYAGALGNRGALLLGMGRFQEALADFDRTLAHQPASAAVLNNRANVLRELDRAQEALLDYDRALALAPGDAQIWSNRGTALWDLGRLDEALASCDRALACDPDLAIAPVIAGQILMEQGKIDAAIGCFRQALDLNPDHAEGLGALGNALRLKGDLAGAQSCYRHVCKVCPAEPAAAENLALLLLAQGQADQALRAILPLLDAKEPGQAGKIFADCLAQLAGRDDAQMRDFLAQALGVPWARPSELAPAAAAFLKAEPELGGAIARADAAWPGELPWDELSAAMRADDPLLLALLGATPNADVALERFLTMARRNLLRSARSNADDGRLEFHGALARQCFINDYVFASGDRESGEAMALRNDLVGALETGSAISPLSVAAVAAYFPLGEVACSGRLLDRAWPAPVEALLRQQILEPAEERRLQDHIPSLTAIAAPVSQDVQAQYAQFPYPRWVKAPAVAPARSVASYLHGKFPLAPFQRLNGAQVILIAGCGTGQHGVTTARKFPQAHVLALDLSKPSLGYAMRMSRGLGNIQYAQADLMELGTLEKAGRKFDVIESVGVLHHLAEPLAGWDMLLSLLRPGGFMMLGLYSRAARREITAARTFIAQQGAGAAAEDIRRCRQMMLAPENRARFASIIRSPDFFSLSGCRDLLFHVQEHCFDLAEIAAFLRERKLAFLGFEISGAVLDAYRRQFAGDPAARDLAQWQAFERENPDCFAGMYQFWIQKPA